MNQITDTADLAPVPAAASRPAAPLGPWMQTASGRAVDLLNPHRDQIALGDIAHHLARIARFNGGTQVPDIWSVAQHSLLVAALVQLDAEPTPPLLRLAALLHDAHEAYCGDMIRPMKQAMREFHPAARAAIHHIEDALQRAIHAALHLPADLPVAWALRIGLADEMALAIERRDLPLPCEREWEDLPTPDANGPRVRPARIALVADMFAHTALACIREHHGVREMAA